jgi:hypothetical protein
LGEAMRSNDYEKAGEFLDRRYLPKEMEEYSNEDLVKALSYVWSRQNISNLAGISDDPRGNLNDGLPSYRDQVGSVTISTGEIPIYLQQVPDGRGGKVWKLSNATVAQIPQMWEELGYSPVAIYLSDRLPDFSFMGMDNWQVLGTTLYFIVAWPLAMLASYVLMRLALMVPNRFPLGIARFFRRYMRFFLFFMIARGLIDQLGLSLTARILLESSGLNYIAYTILLMGLLSLARDYQIRKMGIWGRIYFFLLFFSNATQNRSVPINRILILARLPGEERVRSGEQPRQSLQAFAFVTDLPCQEAFGIAGVSQAKFCQCAIIEVCLDSLARQVADTDTCQYRLDFLIYVLNIELLAAAAKTFAAGDINGRSIMCNDASKLWQCSDYRLLFVGQSGHRVT